MHPGHPGHPGLIDVCQSVHLSFDAHGIDFSNWLTDCTRTVSGRPQSFLPLLPDRGCDFGLHRKFFLLQDPSVQLDGIAELVDSLPVGHLVHQDGFVSGP